MNTKLLAIALFSLTAGAVALYPSLKSGATVGGSPPDNPQTVTQPKIEVVFVLDTTGSMSGLIATAKEKIWSIATSMAQADQAPQISMGLVAYRDRGDDYVTRIVDLSPDLDSMYAALMDFNADGGGDGPESVNEALHDAIHSMSWSQDPSSYKVVFLVGDAPPHMDYNEVGYPDIVAAAAARGIVVNTIQCGDVQQTVHAWTEIARLGNGRYFQVEQAGNAVAFATPFDEDIALLSAELDQTRLYYGSDEQRAAMDLKMSATEKLHEFASLASRARRAVFNASVSGAANLFGERDLIDDVENGRIDLSDIPEEELPEAVLAVPKENQQALVDETAERRAGLQERIEVLAGQRDEFLADKVERIGGAADSLDRQIYDVVREQAAPKGLVYEDGPKY